MDQDPLCCGKAQSRLPPPAASSGPGPNLGGQGPGEGQHRVKTRGLGGQTGPRVKPSSSVPKLCDFGHTLTSLSPSTDPIPVTAFTGLLIRSNESVQVRLWRASPGSLAPRKRSVNQRCGVNASSASRPAPASHGWGSGGSCPQGRGQTFGQSSGCPRPCWMQAATLPGREH